MAFPSLYSLHQLHAHSCVSLTLSASVSLLLGTILKFSLKGESKDAVFAN